MDASSPPFGDEAEYLREIILDLEKSRAREAELRRQSDALITGLRALVATEDRREALSLLLTVYQEILDLDRAVILTGCSREPDMHAEVATDAAYEGFRTPIVGPIARACSGYSFIASEMDALPAQIVAPGADGQRPASAIVAPLESTSCNAVMIGLKIEPLGFDKRHRRMLEGLAPLAGQALLGLEQRERLLENMKRMATLLDCAPYGIVTIEDGLVIGADVSKSTTEVFERDIDEIKGAPAVDVLSDVFGIAGDERAVFREALDVCIGEDVLNWHLNYAHLPTEIEVHAPRHRVFNLYWSPMMAVDGQTVTSVLLAMRDVTEEREMKDQIEARDREHAETLAALDVCIQAPRHGLASFFAEADVRFDFLEAALDSVAIEHSRVLGELHTLKGAARLVGFAELNGAIHRMEDALAPWSRDALDRPAIELASVERAWQDVQARYRPLRRVFRDVFRSGQEAGDASTITSICASSLSDARRSLGAMNIELRTLIDDRAGALSRDVADALRTAFQHLVSNMVDHSIAPAVATNKRRRPRIAIEALQRNDLLRVTLRDNGRGFDIDAILRRAAACDLPVPEHDPLSVVFAPGFSTQDRITQTSGRGIGMTAVNDALLGVSGAIRLDNARTGGSVISISVPKSR